MQNQEIHHGNWLLLGVTYFFIPIKALPSNWKSYPMGGSLPNRGPLSPISGFFVHDITPYFSLERSVIYLRVLLSGSKLMMRGSSVYVKSSLDEVVYVSKVTLTIPCEFSGPSLVVQTRRFASTL